MRILGVALNGRGIGHLNRILGIFKAIKIRNPNFEVLILTKSEYISHAKNYNIPVIKLPYSQFINESNVRYYKYIAAEIILNFNPNMIIIDSRIGGLFGEILSNQILEKNYIVFLRRLVKKSRRKEIYRWCHYINHMIILKEGMSIDQEDFENIKLLCQKVDIVNPITILNINECYPWNQARKYLGIKDNKKINLLLAFGASGIEYSLLSKILNGLKTIKDLRIWVAKPLYADFPPRIPGVYIIQEIPLMKILSAFDLVISSAGYNTVNELYKLSIPTILLPQERELDDQFLRAQMLQSQSPGVFTVYHQTEEIAHLIQIVRGKIALLRKKPRSSFLNNCINDGAQEAVKLIFKRYYEGC